MTPRIRPIVIALRIAYACCLALFALSVLVAFAASVTTVDTDGGGFSIVAELPDDSPALIAVNWIALGAFVSGAIGAALTVLAHVVGTAEPGTGEPGTPELGTAAH